MDSTNENRIIAAVTSSNIQESKGVGSVDLDTGTSFLKNEAISASISASGSAYTSQNNTLLVDMSRNVEQNDLLELAWSYKMATSKPYILDTGGWSTSDITGFTLLSFPFPNNYFTGNHVLKTIGETFMSVRGDLHFVVSLQGTPMASGALIVHANYYTQGLADLNEMYFRQHAVLDASDNSSTCDLVVPYRYWKNGTDPFSEIYTVYIQVLVPLAGITNMNYTVSCFLENQEFKFLRPIEATTTRVTHGLLNITNINNTLSNVENATLPTNMTGDTLDVKATLMDDVGINTNSAPFLLRFPALNNMDNPHPIDKMALTSHALQLSTKDTFNSQIDEMSFKHILQEHDHYHSTLSMSTSTTVGEQIKVIPIVPNPKTMITPSDSVTDMNIMEYYAGFFKYWRGGLKYKIRFFMNRFQSMKFYVGLFYKAITPDSFTDWSSSHGVIVDIGGDKREIEIEIPYNAETPWLHLPKGFIDIENITNPDYTPFDFILGQLAIYAVTPLISPTGSPTTITAHVTMTTSDDFEFANFSTNYTSSVAQGDVVKLSKDSTRTPDFNQDVIVSVKQLTKKWSTVFSQNTQLMDVAYVNTAACFNVGSVLGSYTRYNTGQSNYTFLRSYDLGNIDGLFPFQGYNGGIKLHVEMSFTPGRIGSATGPIYDWYKPYAIYFNPEVLNSSTARNIDVNRIAGQLDYFLDTGNYDNRVVPSAYHILPINNVGLVTDTVIYEIEIPFQRTTKFMKRDGFFGSHGFLVLGYKRNFPTPEGMEVQPSYSLKIMAKISDDGRLGVLNNAPAILNQAENIRVKPFYDC